MKILLATIGIAVVGSLLFLFYWLNLGTAQPIAFNHKLHVTELKLECSHCHTGVATKVFASLPSVEICMGCHVAELSQNPEEAKVRAYAEKGVEIPWHRLTRVPDHVYFSHQRHVSFGHVSCEPCHGKMEERSQPPKTAPGDLSMDDCLECHRKNGASEDCISCHR